MMCMYVYMYIYIYICIYVYVHIYVYTYVYRMIIMCVLSVFELVKLACPWEPTDMRVKLNSMRCA